MPRMFDGRRFDFQGIDGPSVNNVVKDVGRRVEGVPPEVDAACEPVWDRKSRQEVLWKEGVHGVGGCKGKVK